VRPGTIETPSYEETKPKTDPFAGIAAEVKEQAEKSPQITPEKEQKQDQMKEQEKDMMQEHKQNQMKEQEKEKDMVQEQKQEHMGPKTVSVSIPYGTSVPGCEETNECYIPYKVSILTGDTVSWFNDDTAAHTVTSGSPQSGPDGNFDSSLILGGAVYEFTFEQEGSYDYFCMVHPWMTGIVQVN
jgi:plastocyanin